MEYQTEEHDGTKIEKLLETLVLKLYPYSYERKTEKKLNAWWMFECDRLNITLVTHETSILWVIPKKGESKLALSLKWRVLKL